MNSWTISRRLTAGFAAVVSVVLILSGMFLFDLNRIDKQVTSIATDSLPGLAISHRALEETLNLRVLMLRMVATSDPAQLKDLGQQSDALFSRNAQTFKDYAGTITTTEDRENFQRAEAALQRYKTVNEQIRALALAGNNADAHALIASTGIPTYKAFEETMIVLTDWNEKAAHVTATATIQVMKSTRRLTVILVCTAVLVAIGSGVFITRGVNRVVRAVADSLNEGSQQVTAAAAQVSASGQTLAEGASEQAASLEETSASLEEISSMVKRNAEGALQAKDLSNETRTAADAGASEMQQMMQAMDAIKNSSDGISKIIKTIDDIAFQTNILALNAAVEAARAGEAGMGFAVVADEVRSLAQRSAQSARETAAKIEEAIEKSEHGVLISSKVAQSLSLIVEKARKVDALVAEIAGASQEQSQGIGQVNTAVSEMDKITQSNAASAEETAAAAEELSAQAVCMRENVGELTKLVGGAQTGAAGTAPHTADNATGPRKPVASVLRQSGMSQRGVHRPAAAVINRPTAAGVKGPQLDDLHFKDV